MAGGRPTVWTEEKKKQLKAIMRLKPTLNDCAAFLEVHPDSITKHLRNEHKLSFLEFREQNMVHTRFSLIRNALKQAENGNTAMMIFCLKNLCGWQDKVEATLVADPKIKIEKADEGIVTDDFRKTEKQREATRLLSGHARDVMFFGGSRSGKTFLLVYAIIVRAAKVKSRHAILRLKFNHAKRSIWLDTLPKVIRLCFPNLGIRDKDYNKSDYYLKLHNGSKIWIGGLDDKERVEKILGNEYSTVYFNESSQIDYRLVQMAKTRLAEKNDLTKKAYYDCNPPSKTHWSYWLFEKKLDPLEDVPLKKPERYASLRMNPEDNLENIDEEYLELLESMPEKDRNRFLKGLYGDADDGQAYYSFDRERHVGPTTVEPGTLFIGMDFNVNPMTAVIFQFLGDEFLIHDEAFLENSDTFKMCDHLKKKKYMGNVIPDSTGKSRKTSGKSDFKILRENGFVLERVRNPFVTDRVNNVNRLFTANRIIINPRCKKLINDLEKVAWKDNKLDQKTDPMLTHISDALGYGLYKLDPIVTRTSGQSSGTM